DHPQTATSLNNLAGFYHRMNDYARVKPCYLRALKIREKELGPDHPQTAVSLNNLAALYSNMGDYAKAEPLYQRALKICEKALGPDHPQTAKNLNNLKWLFFDLNKKQSALDIARKAQKAQLKTLNNILSFTSEQQRLSYQETLNPYSLFASMGSAPDIALAILRYKGIVLDSLLEDRLVAETSEDPEHRAMIEQIRSRKQRLTQLLLEIPKDVSEQALKKRAAEREQLSREAEQLEGDLARHVAGLGRARRALSLTVEQVQKAIPEHAVMLEFLHYDHYLGKNTWEGRYGAVIIPPTGEPRWVILGKAQDIDKMIGLYQRQVRNKTDEKFFAALLGSLYRQVWAPVEPSLPEGTRDIIISPDGALNFISFATLLTPDDQFLGQRYGIRYVASGRDLLRETAPSPVDQMTMFTNPVFAGKGIIASGGTSTVRVALRSLEMRDLQTIRLEPLPGTAKERAFLQARARKWKWPIAVFEKHKATEAQLYATRSPRILHLATHGFFLSEDKKEGGERREGFGVMGGEEQRRVILQNPMHRSGFALAGAQDTLDAWKRGDMPDTGNDGIVTAEEVGGLKLGETQLVVLSACDTGVGESRSGEGVLGLRRGFIQAGAQHLMMTLWPVTDEITPEIMVDFYHAFQKSNNAPQALVDVQRTWLVKLRQERGLYAAVNIAGPFILSSQGHQ
ncbi:MAG: hypothetical protein B6D35_12695, partial [Candidatus Brocadia sp. UTAMX2]